MSTKVVPVSRSYAVAGSILTLSGIAYTVAPDLTITVPDTFSDDDLAAALGAAVAAQPAGSPAPVDAVASTKILNSGAPNADLTLTAKTKGNLVPPVTITLVNPGATHSESIVTAGQNIVITLGYATGAITSTANSVKATIDGDTNGAAKLVTVAVEGSGAGLVDAFTIQSLASGIDGTPGVAGAEIFAAGNKYLDTAASTTATAGAWKKETIGSL
jgi:hypothetical protein